MDALDTLMEHDARFAADVKYTIGVMLLGWEDHHDDFETSPMYQELLAKSEIFRQAVEEEWKFVEEPE